MKTKANTKAILRERHKQRILNTNTIVNNQLQKFMKKPNVSTVRSELPKRYGSPTIVEISTGLVLSKVWSKYRSFAASK